MKIITNNKNVALEVLSAQNLLNADIEMITIESIKSQKYLKNDYDAKITIKGTTFILYRDLNFKNVNIKNILNANLSEIQFINLYR